MKNYLFYKLKSTKTAIFYIVSIYDIYVVMTSLECVLYFLLQEKDTHVHTHNIFHNLVVYQFLQNHSQQELHVGQIS